MSQIRSWQIFPSLRYLQMDEEMNVENEVENEGASGRLLTQAIDSIHDFMFHGSKIVLDNDGNNNENVD